ncbi:MAG: hypothetical protein QME25_00250 [Bacteroidota bacterium]|nr:hypothetical protein [Bacteroidota bacterium]
MIITSPFLRTYQTAEIISYLTIGTQVGIEMKKTALACIEVNHPIRQNNCVLK